MIMYPLKMGDEIRSLLNYLKYKDKNYDDRRKYFLFEELKWDNNYLVYEFYYQVPKIIEKKEVYIKNNESQIIEIDDEYKEKIKNAKEIYKFNISYIDKDNTDAAFEIKNIITEIEKSLESINFEIREFNDILYTLIKDYIWKIRDIKEFGPKIDEKYFVY